MHVVREMDEKIALPEVVEGSEITHLGYKYSNSSGIILSSPEVVRCEWKPASIDDGWKQCEVIFEIEDKRAIKSILSNLNVGLEFEDKENIRNLKIFYSNDFDIGTDSYLGEVEESEKKDPNLIGLSASSKRGDLSEKKNKGDVFVKIKKKKFVNFVSINNLRSNITQDNSILDADINESFNETFAPRNLSETNNSLVYESLQNPTEQGIPPPSLGDNTTEQNVSEIKDRNNSAQEPLQTGSDNQSLGQRAGNQSTSIIEEPEKTELNETISVLEEQTENFTSGEPETGDSIVEESEEKESKKDRDKLKKEEPEDEVEEGPEESDEAFEGEEASEAGDSAITEVASEVSSLVFLSSIYNYFISLVSSESYGGLSSFGSPKSEVMQRLIGVDKKNKKSAIDTDEPFAIKVSFEVPKYSSNQFDFKLTESGFSAYIDPVVSSCGTLSSENGIYTMDRNVESIGACFSVTANNVTLDCQGNRIRYSSAGTTAYGVYSTTNFTTIRNCDFLSGDLNNRQGIGVYFLGSDNSSILDNTFDNGDHDEIGIDLINSDGVQIYNNTLDVFSTNSLGIYSENSNEARIYNNIINTSESGQSGIYLISNTGTNISNNNLIIYNNLGNGVFSNQSSDLYLSVNNITINGNSSHGIFVEEAEDAVIESNEILTSGNVSYGIYASSNSITNIIRKNFVQTLGSFSRGIYLYGSDYHTLDSNKIYTYGAQAPGITLESGTYYNLNNETIVTKGSNSNGMTIINSDKNNVTKSKIETNSSISYGILLDSHSDRNIIDYNNITTFGTDSYAIHTSSPTNNISYNNLLTTNSYAYVFYLLSGANNNNFSYNNLTSLNSDSYGIFLESGPTGNLFENNLVTTFGDLGYGILLYDSDSNNFTENSIITTGSDSSGIFLDSSTNNNYFSGMNINTNNTNSDAIFVYLGNHNFSIENSILVASSSGEDEVYIDSGITGGIFNFTNVSFTNVGWHSSANGELIVNWHLDVLIKYSNDSNIGGVNVSVSNMDGMEFLNLLTSAGGRISQQTLLSYIQNGTGDFTYYSNYTINATISGESLNREINLSENKFETLAFTAPEAAVAPTEDGGGGGGGGGGGIIGNNNSLQKCSSQWKCEAWSDCIDGKQGRICENLNPDCDKKKPDIERTCKTAGLKPNKNSRDTLFDINLRVLEKRISPDDKLSGTVSLINLGIPGKVQANLVYQIKDETGKVYYEEKEVVPVETQIEFIKTIDVEGFPPGKYNLWVDLSYVGQKEPARALDSFSVGEGFLFQFKPPIIIFVLINALILFCVFLIIYFRHQIKKLRTNVLGPEIDTG